MGLLIVLWTSGIVSTAANGWVGLGSIWKKTGLHLQNSIGGGIECLLPANPGSSEGYSGFPHGESSDVTFLTSGGPQQVMWKHTLDSVGCVLDTRAPLGRARCRLTLALIARDEPFGEWEGNQRWERDVSRQALLGWGHLESLSKAGVGVGAVGLDVCRARAACQAPCLTPCVE